MKTNIIRLHREVDLVPQDMHPDIAYTHELDINNLIEQANRIYVEGLGLPERTSTEMIRNWLGKELEGELVEELQDYYIPQEDLEYYQTLEDFMDEDEEYFLEKIFENDTESRRVFFQKNDLTFGTVGYSGWAYFLAYKDIDKSFVEDYYEGDNFYFIEWVNSGNKRHDQISFVYLTDDKDLEEMVKDHFGITDFYLVDNEDARYFDHQKIQESSQLV